MIQTILPTITLLEFATCDPVLMGPFCYRETRENDQQPTAGKTKRNQQQKKKVRTNNFGTPTLKLFHKAIHLTKFAKTVIKLPSTESRITEKVKSLYDQIMGINVLYLKS